MPPFRQNIARETCEQLEAISAYTIDRLLAPVRRLHTKRGLATTKPSSLLKQYIPIKTSPWDEHIPGFLEADTVAHCGTSMAGIFAFTLNAEQRALWGKGERNTLEALSNIEAALPFRLRGFDCDNGSEFINWTILAHYTKRTACCLHTLTRASQER